MDDSTFPDLAAVLDAGAFPNDDADVQACLIEALVELATDEAGVPRTIELRRSYGPLRRGLSWATDLLEVPSLADRVFDQYDVTFRLEVEQTIDQVRRSHPIYVGRRGDGPGPGAGGWQCASCGDVHSNDDSAFVVGDRPDFSDLPYAITYCVPCIRIAAAALEGVR